MGNNSFLMNLKSPLALLSKREEIIQYLFTLVQAQQGVTDPQLLTLIANLRDIDMAKAQLQSPVLPTQPPALTPIPQPQPQPLPQPAIVNPYANPGPILPNPYITQPYTAPQFPSFMPTATPNPFEAMFKPNTFMLPTFPSSSQGFPSLTNPESLKVRYQAVIDSIHPFGKKCSHCGLRMKENKYDEHLNWHFNFNARQRDKLKGHNSRDWYFPLSAWLQVKISGLTIRKSLLSDDITHPRTLGGSRGRRKTSRGGSPQDNPQSAGGSRAIWGLFGVW